jgi:hypothetical protein
VLLRLIMVDFIVLSVLVCLGWMGRAIRDLECMNGESRTWERLTNHLPHHVYCRLDRITSHLPTFLAVQQCNVSDLTFSCGHYERLFNLC